MPKMLSILVVVFILLCSCAPHYSVPENAKIIPGVPFYPQEDYQCGPASLATVMNYWQARSNKEKIGVKEITDAIYSRGARGVLPSDLENYPVTRGFITHQFEGSIEDLRGHVDQGIPVIIFVDQGLSIYQVNHFMVVTGYTDNGVVVNDGRREKEVITNSRLEKTWKRTGYWALRVVPS